jgi:hypothetical protein
MRNRVNNPDDPHWPRWGGRGIRICDRWQEFGNFLADMGERPPGTTLDRISNDGDYESGNCRWATPPEQTANSRASKLTADMIAEILERHAVGAGQRELGRRFGVSHAAIAAVIRRQGNEEAAR